MNHFHFVAACAIAFAASGAACTADIHDNTFNTDAKVDVKSTVNLDDVAVGQSVPFEVTVTNVHLIEPTETPPANKAAEAGHLRYYMDDMSTTAILISAKVKVDIKIPEGTSPGDHKIHCRVHKHDGTATTTTFVIKIKVKATVKT